MVVVKEVNEMGERREEQLTQSMMCNHMWQSVLCRQMSVLLSC